MLTRSSGRTRRLSTAYGAVEEIGNLGVDTALAM